MTNTDENTRDTLAVRLDEMNERYRQLEERFDRRNAELHGLLRRLARSQRQTQRAYAENIRMLVELTDARHRGTGGHLERIRTYARILAEAMDLPASERELLQLAAPMHDIGKVAIPDRILSKQGLLTEEERKLVERHTVIGHEILKSSVSDLMAAGAEIALTHHERWDGSGYPHGVAGDDIPLFGRIVAVVDVYDALTTNRPYRRASPPADAIAMIEAAQGQFDPTIVDAFQAERRRFERAHESMSASVN